MLPDIWARVCVARYTIDTGEKKRVSHGENPYLQLPTYYNSLPPNRIPLTTSLGLLVRQCKPL